MEKNPMKNNEEKQMKNLFKKLINDEKSVFFQQIE